METQPPKYTLQITADRHSVRDVVKGLLHTIFFHRVFTALYPSTHDVLDLTLPYVSEEDVESTIDARTTSLLRALDTSSIELSSQYSSTKSSHGKVVVQFLEKKRRKGGWFTKADEETLWEVWVIDVTVTTARSEIEASRNRRRMERGLQDAALRVLEVVNQDRGYIPPITTNDTNPFPFQIVVNPKNDGGGQKVGIFQ